MVGALGGAVFMLLLSNIDVVTRGDLSLPALVPPFGASVAIVFFSPQSPLAKPWNVIVGHFASALTACTFLWLFPEANRGLLCALAVSGAGLAMIATKSFHPPGGATALLAVVLDHRLGFAMAFCPVLVGAITLVCVRTALDVIVAMFTQPVQAARMSSIPAPAPSIVPTQD